MQKHSSARRALLGALAAFALVPIAACDGRDTRPGSSPSPAASSPHAGSTGPATSAKPFDRERFARQFKDLERKYDARLGVYAIDTGTGREVTHNDGERFAHASTFKALAAGCRTAQVLAGRNGRGDQILQERPGQRLPGE